MDDPGRAPGADTPAPGSKADGYAPVGEKVIYLSTNFTQNTAAHEFGHSAGLKHIDETTQTDLNFPVYQSLQYGVSYKNAHVPNTGDVGLQEIIGMRTTRYTSNDFRGNLMHRGVMKDAAGNWMPNPNRGYKVVKGQVESIIYKLQNNISINGPRQR